MTARSFKNFTSPRFHVFPLTKNARFRWSMSPAHDPEKPVGIHVERIADGRRLQDFESLLVGTVHPGQFAVLNVDSGKRRVDSRQEPPAFFQLFQRRTFGSCERSHAVILIVGVAQRGERSVGNSKIT